jgi:hypothetical protein
MLQICTHVFRADKRSLNTLAEIFIGLITYCFGIWLHFILWKKSVQGYGGYVCGWMLEGESTPSSGRRCAELGRESISVTGFGERRSALLPRACSISASFGVRAPDTVFPKSCLPWRPETDFSTILYSVSTLAVVTSPSVTECTYRRLLNPCVGCSIYSKCVGSTGRVMSSLLIMWRQETWTWSVTNSIVRGKVLVAKVTVKFFAFDETR